MSVIVPNGLSVLIVDDAAITRALLRRVLGEQGYDVREADSAEVAIRLYHERRPDVVTMDIHMAKISGLGAIQVLLRMDPSARIIVVSSEHSTSIILEAMKTGAKAYIGKPFTAESVLAAVQKALA